jgi:uncharacterized protein YndB with AHSA1/START domain
MAGRKQLVTSVTIGRPPAEVFDYLADVRKHAEWSPKPYRVEGVDGPVTKGSTFTSYGWVPRDSDHRNDVEVTEFDPPSRLVLRSQEKDQFFVNTFELSAEGAGTKVVRTMDMPNPGGVMALLLPVLVAGLIKPGVQKGMNMLKDNLEQPA